MIINSYDKGSDNIQNKEKPTVKKVIPEVENCFPKAGKTIQEIILELLMKDIEKASNGAVSSSVTEQNVV